MKTYKRFKDFIPDSFYIRKHKQKKKYENLLIFIFLIANLILMSVNLKKINTKTKKDVKSIEIQSYSDIGSFNLLTINHIVDEVFENKFEKVYINNNCGEILIENLNDIDMINRSGLLNIIEVDAVEEGKYKIGVNVDE
ncbi:hypothetical protein [uncultured Clostridium sp.]|uniref:hypothetical protein n=1 Tax=uncultured Clostridium sp. TaxID=59620 RepID=UPI0025F8A3F9|nr:hypothetical protein [uncultured Clostridium sp.]